MSAHCHAAMTSMRSTARRDAVMKRQAQASAPTSPTGSQSSRPAGVVRETGRRLALTGCRVPQGTLPTSSLHKATTCRKTDECVK